MAAGPSAGVELIWRRASKGLPRSRLLCLGVCPAGITLAGRLLLVLRVSGGSCRWLAAGRVPADKAEPVKYWLSNLPERTPLVELVRLARCVGGLNKITGN